MEKWIIELKEYAETNVVAMLIGYIYIYKLIIEINQI